MNMRNRHKHVIANNKRARTALDRYPPETWSFEILEWLPHDKKLSFDRAIREQYEAEQRHIDRLRTQSPEFGFNIFPAVKPRQQDDAA
jgi:hypothetical protein